MADVDPDGSIHALIKKWEDGIDPTNATKTELQEYLTTKLFQYTMNRTTDDNLWDLFQDDFKNFNVAAFNQYTRTEL